MRRLPNNLFNQTSFSGVHVLYSGSSFFYLNSLLDWKLLVFVGNDLISLLQFGQVEQYLVLLKKFCPKSLEPKNLGQVKIVKNYQTAHLLAELPIEHQIQELINAAGSEGIIMSNVSALCYSLFG